MIELNIIDNMVIEYWGRGGAVVIPDGVEGIAPFAFCDCDKITSITIPDSVKKIGKSAFSDCKGLADEKGFLIVRNVLYNYYGTDSVVEVPYGITTIEDNAFFDCQSITAVIIPDTVTTIGAAAFFGCEMLQKVNIPENVKELEKGTFQYCYSLTSVTIPHKLKRIDNRAFFYCTSLETITISDGVKSIGEDAFRGCDKLTSITIPKSITCIGENAFEQCCGLKTIALPESTAVFTGSVLEIVWNYFIKNGHEIRIMCAFLRKCPVLVADNAVLKNKIKSNKKKIISAAIEEDDADVLKNLFSLYKCIKLEELNESLEKAAKAVSATAFLLDYKNENYSKKAQEKYENDKLEKELDFSKRTVSDWKKIYKFETENGKATITDYKGKERQILIPDKIGGSKVICIDECAFSSKAAGLRKEKREARLNIEEIVIPDTVKKIGAYAFYGCENLMSVSISACATIIGDWSFGGCSTLASIILPDSVKSIGVGTFLNCTGLTSVLLPEAIKVIEERTFFNCSSLTSLTIPDGVTSIGEMAFACCDNLTSITIPDSVTSIDGRAFSWCPNLTIYAQAGSFAEEYAKKYEINFTAE